MDWAFWSGSLVFAGTIGGLLLLRNRPLTDVNGHHVDRDGRRVASTTRLIKRALAELLDADNAPRSASALRRRLGLSHQRFDRLVRSMTMTGLIEYVAPREILGNGDVVTFGRYRITDVGIARALGLEPLTPGRHRR